MNKTRPFAFGNLGNPTFNFIYRGLSTGTPPGATKNTRNTSRPFSWAPEREFTIKTDSSKEAGIAMQQLTKDAFMRELKQESELWTERKIKTYVDQRFWEMRIKIMSGAFNAVMLAIACVFVYDAFKIICPTPPSLPNGLVA